MSDEMADAFGESEAINVIRDNSVPDAMILVPMDIIEYWEEYMPEDVRPIRLTREEVS